jgi:Tfp pilus assembly protein PilF
MKVRFSMNPFALPLPNAWIVGLSLAIGLVACRQSKEPLEPSSRIVSEMNRGVSFMGQYLYDDAVRSFEQVLQAAPELSEARINLAIALFNRNRKEDLDTAGKLLAEVLRKEPGNVRALYFNAIVLQHIGKADQAVSCLEQVVQQRPDDGAAWYLLALCKQRVNQIGEAEFLKAVQCRPYLYSAYYQLYQVAVRAGNDTKAAEYLGRFKTLRESPLAESIELPQYGQMGELALARSLPATPSPPIARSKYQLKAAKTVFTWPGAAPSRSDQPLPSLSGAAAGDINHDGLPDLAVPTGRPGRVVLLRQSSPGNFIDATASSGLEGLTNAMSCAFGDYDNDDVPDLFVTCATGDHLLKGKGDGTFTDVTKQAGLEMSAVPSRSALFLDADHDGDLDLFLCNPAANQLWNNNGDGAFTSITARADVACADGRSVLVLPGDLDGDRDMDLVILRESQPARVYLNELLGRYREADLHGIEIRGEAGGALQDFNGDGLLDLLVLGGNPRELKLLLGDGHGQFRPDEAFDGIAKALASWGPLNGFRIADVDLDGDLDIACYGFEVHLLLNDGRGHFVLQAQVWKPSAGATLAWIEVLDVTRDLVPDLVALERDSGNRLLIAPGEVVPPSTALALQPSGIRSRDGRTRSPASGYGVTLTVRAGLREQRILYTGQSGGPGQSLLPAVLGLGGAGRADYVDFLWPDGVAQVEMALAAGQTHKVAELQRKVSSCPVLFAWNGTRFEFVTDFAGVGGLGYFTAPGVSASPQVLEHVKIDPSQLRVREGRYELRIAEPMEESAYIDRLELLAIDHTTNQQIFPDERLAINGPPPTHELLVVDEPLFPVRAVDPSGRDCSDLLRQVDRHYAYEPKLDRRYIGFCQPHTLEIEFDDRLSRFSGHEPVFLFINGFIEYPYSQTVYAASQSRIGWEPIRVERQEPNGRWQTIVPDGGAPGGIARTMTINLTDQLTPATRKLRLTTNLEVFYDQIFIARLGERDTVTVCAVPLRGANLRYAGFMREYSPDGRLPLIYDYDLRDATAPFHKLKGAYTRYGPVEELLAHFDDQYVLVGPGDEIALEFDANRLPTLAQGHTRSFVLVSYAYCKDMDLYTATSQTLEPLPFRSMTRYPYPSTERYPASQAHQTFLRTYNTRIIE